MLSFVARNKPTIRRHDSPPRQRAVATSQQRTNGSSRTGEPGLESDFAIGGDFTRRNTRDDSPYAGREGGHRKVRLRTAR